MDGEHLVCGVVWGLVAATAVAWGCQTGPQPAADELETEIRDATERARTAAEGTDPDPSRIILFIGDGMGLPAVASSSYVAGQPLSMLEMSHFGVMATHEYEFVTTDSAASATAMATGEKTHFNGVAVEPGTGPADEEDPDYQLRNVVEAANEADWKTGLVATVRINHATPAPFGAHRHARHSYEDIALDMSQSGVDVLMGAGSTYFRDREDGRDLLEEMAGRGYRVEDRAPQVREAAGEASRLVGLMHDRDMPWVDEQNREMELVEMVDHSLEVLDRDDPEGFFLMVEGAKIDWAGHRMDGDRVVSETRDMDRALRRALEYARDRTDTLVVVTSDHETGDMDVIDGASADRYLEAMGVGDREAAEMTKPQGLSETERAELAGPMTRLTAGDGEFGPADGTDSPVVPTFGYLSAASRADWDGRGRFSAVHTPQLVPIFAEGAGAREAAAVRDNADLGRRLLAWIDEVEPDVQGADLEEAPPDQEPENIVVLAVDGLGLASLTASYYRFGVPSVLGMSRAGAVATHGTDRLVNDAAGAATALATGARTRRGAVGKAPEPGERRLGPRSSALVQAGGEGRRTGLVSTSSVASPAPGAFYANRPPGADPDGIAEDFVDFHEGRTGLDFVAAGGSADLSDGHERRLRESGVSVLRSWEETAGSGPVHYLLAERGLEPAHERLEEGRQPGLAEMSMRAVERLSGGDDGFFLLVESGGVGAAKAEFDRGERVMAELREFERTSRRLLEFAREDDETLLVVTSLRDHTLGVVDNHYGFDDDGCAAAARCGGAFEMEWFDVAAGEVRHGGGLESEALQGEFAPPEIALQYPWLAQRADFETEVTAPYSANFVPLFAEGPGAERLAGFHDQPAVGRQLVDWARGVRQAPRSAMH